MTLCALFTIERFPAGRIRSLTETDIPTSSGQACSGSTPLGFKGSSMTGMSASSCGPVGFMLADFMPFRMDAVMNKSDKAWPVRIMTGDDQTEGRELMESG